MRACSQRDVKAYRDQGSIDNTAEARMYPSLFRDLSEPVGRTAVIIGAAAKKLPSGLKERYAGRPEQELADQRDNAKQYGFGIGRMAALHLAARGYNIVGTYASSEGPARELELMLRSHFGVEARMLKLDTTKTGTMAGFVDRVYELFGGVDALIYAPSVQARRGDYQLITAEDMIRSFNGNCVSLHLLAQNMMARLDGVEPDDHGIKLRIANAGSISEMTPSPGRTDYCAAKAADMAVTRCISVAREDAREVMAFNAVISIVNTAATVDVREKYQAVMAELSEKGRMFEAEEIAYMLVENLVDKHNNHGKEIDMTGGFKARKL